MTDNDKTPIIEPSQIPTLEGCPFCGADCSAHESRKVGWVECLNVDCQYTSGVQATDTEAIAVHNQLCLELAYGKRAIAVVEKPPPCTMTIDETKKLTQGERLTAHKYYSWAVLDILDLLQPPSEVPGRGE